MTNAIGYGAKHGAHVIGNAPKDEEEKESGAKADLPLLLDLLPFAVCVCVCDRLDRGLATPRFVVGQCLQSSRLRDRLPIMIPGSMSLSVSLFPEVIEHSLSQALVLGRRHKLSFGLRQRLCDSVAKIDFGLGEVAALIVGTIVRAGLAVAVVPGAQMLGLLLLFLGLADLVGEPVDAPPQAAAEQGQDDKVDAEGCGEEASEQQLQTGKGGVGGQQERRGSARGEDRVPEVCEEVCHDAVDYWFAVSTARGVVWVGLGWVGLFAGRVQ